jgi:hypothetical protein
MRPPVSRWFFSRGPGTTRSPKKRKICVNAPLTDVDTMQSSYGFELMSIDMKYEPLWTFIGKT